MANGGPDADVIRFVEVTADRLHDRLAELSMYICTSLEAEIPELRGRVGRPTSSSRDNKTGPSGS